MRSGSTRQKSMKRGCLWLLLILGLGMPLVAFSAGPPGDKVLNPGAELWKEVRGRQPAPATTQVQGRDTAVLINPWGERFRDYRRDRYIRYSGYLLAGVVGLLLLYHLLHGGLEVAESGRKVLRFEATERIVHWLLAVVFLALAVTGAILAFGRFVILPWLGGEAFSVIAAVSKQAHNLLGPLFIVALLWFFVLFVGRNLPKLVDLLWLIRAGGMLGGGHPPAGFFNGGEKIWFWILAVGGAVVSASGIVLDFPSLVEGRDPLVLALVVHGAAAVILIAASFGHMYLGTVGVKGSLQGMITGLVDEAWARTHHALWYEQLKGKKKAVERNAGE
ncbi:MAG: formate dehydrogenase subunit gamma [Gammaproteobacteria bacterium]|nr:MAG: formate dehydrogenase subunit gamma [Gammaproteobacteria bacterium]